jgi:hypothetical protein
MDQDAFEDVVNRLAGDESGDDPDRVAPANQFRPLRERLAFGPAGVGEKVAQDVANPGQGR